MKVYAGIGSQKFTTEQWDLCFKIGRWLALNGWTLKTGACQGADQAFAEGALSVGGKVILYIPWPHYEFKWVEVARGRGAETVLLQYWHKDAWNSVDKFHPNPEALSKGARALHARNFLIVEDTRFVIAWPRIDRQGRLGGTGQGLRIAEDLKIDVIRLDEPIDRKRVEDKINS